jgi:hypothetical protein
MGARDEGRALEAIKQLQAENINDGSVHWLKLDLSDPRAAQRAAQEFLEKEKRLDIIGEFQRISFYPRMLSIFSQQRRTVSFGILFCFCSETASGARLVPSNSIKMVCSILWCASQSNIF